MLNNKLRKNLTPWIEDYKGISYSKLSDTEVPIFLTKRQIGSGDGERKDLIAIEIEGKRGLVVSNESLLPELESLIDRLDPTTIYSSYGFFEMSRITLEYGISVWGPDWFLFCDNETVNTQTDPRVEQVDTVDLSAVDYDEFWHCDPQALTGFAIRQGENIAALATLTKRNEPVYEIGMDVSQSQQGTGLGRAVVSSAAQWVLKNGDIPMAVLSPFNIPSMRTLTSSGLRYLFQSMSGATEEFRVPPQPLGMPRPNTKMYNHYPDWAINNQILPKKKR